MPHVPAIATGAIKAHVLTIWLRCLAIHWYIQLFAPLEPSAPFAPLELFAPLNLLDPFAPLNPLKLFAPLLSMLPYLYHGHRSLNSGALDLAVQQFKIGLQSYDTYYTLLFP